MKRLARQLWNQLPPGRLRTSMARFAHLVVPDTVASKLSSTGAMATEIAQLPIEELGTNGDGTCWIRFSDGLQFHGYDSGSPELTLYDRWPKNVQEKIPADLARLAIDIVCRYLYPQADASIRVPYPLEQRQTFHPQHSDTIWDLAQLSKQEQESLSSFFAIGQGDYVIDVGAFIGIGALRLSDSVGEQGRILSVEALPANQELFATNMSKNDIHNVQLVRKGIWKEPGSLTLECSRLQENSLVSDVVERNDTVTVETDTIDNIVNSAGWDRVTHASITINAAEIEAIEGMHYVLTEHAPRLSIAGWYKRDGRPVHELIVPILHKYGYRSLVGPVGRIYAWKEE